jgi:hypothetical protein
MRVLLSLLDANLALHQHAASALDKALERHQLLPGQQTPINEQAFFNAYNALRDVETEELRLLHETALLAQLLRREESARQTEHELDQTFRAQEVGNGKKAVIVSKDALIKQEKTVAKDHRQVYQHAEQMVDIFLAQYEALVRADRLFRALDPRLVLLQSHAEAAILKIFVLAEDSPQKLRDLVKTEVERNQPRDLAAGLAAHRSKMRQHLTKLSEARRHFAAFIQQRLPMIGTL